MKRLRLAALRLVGFHNYQDVTLSVKGDVFLIGQNESGKTTVLDAIQLVLSAEKHFIWNAGASPTGRRNEGRSLKGIVLRSDLSGAPRNEAGVAWAGLEFRPADNYAGVPLTLLFGASVRSVDASVQKHGAQLSLPLDEIPLTECDGDGRLRVLRREEVAERTGAEIRGQIGSYLGELESLFGGASSFDRVTTLWQLAKSYKDLAVRTRKLSDLFVEFLPAPDPGPFQQVRKGLQDAREIEVQLEELRIGRDQLRELADLLGKLNAEREGVLRLDYMLAQHERAQLEKDRDQREDVLFREKEKLRASEQQLGLTNGELLEGESEQEVLRSSEAMGLVERLRVAEQEARREQETHQAQQRRVDKLQREVERLLQEAGKAEALIRRAAANLQAMVQHLEAKLDAISGTIHPLLEFLSADASMLAGDDRLQPSAEELRASVESLLPQVEEKLRKTNEQLSQVNANAADLCRQRARLEHHEEVLPELEGYAELLADLESRELKFAPLYRFLEPDGLQDQDVARLEEFLGIDFLATLVPEPEHSQEVRRVVQERCPTVRVLDSRIAGGMSLPPFLRCRNARVAAHTAALFHELEVSDHEPEEETAGLRISRTGVAFRAGARSGLAAAVPSFVGSETRAARRAAELDRLDRALADEEASRLRLQESVDSIRERREALRAVHRAFHGEGAATELIFQCAQHRRHLELLKRERELLHDEEKESAKALARWQRAQQREQQLREQAAATDAQRIVERLASLDREIKKLRECAKALDNKMAVSKHSIQTITREIEGLCSRLAEQAPRLATARDALLSALEPVPADLDDYVYRTRQGQRGGPETLGRRLTEAREQAARLDQQLRGRDGILRPEFAASYRFRVEESGRSQVLTHDGKALPEVLHQREQDVDEWSDRRTRRLREVFESLLEKELIGRLMQDRRHLRDRIDRLNRRLESVTFGGNQYRISHTVRPEARWLEEGLKAQGLLAEEARQTLRESIENRAEMMEEGEAGVPPALDYRHWYEFDFRIARRGQAEAQSSDITRGSGGAQASYNYLLLFCLAANFFDESDSPIRILVMDEAFHNLDADRKQRLLLAAKDLDLDLVIATPDIDGTTLGTDYDSTTVLVEKDAEDNVALIPLIFEREDNDLFAAPRGEAVIRSEPEE